MTWLYIIIGVGLLAAIIWLIQQQRSLKLRAHLMQEAIRNRDFTFRLPTDGLLPGERAMQQTLNQLGETIRQMVNQSEVESWERLTRVLTHEMMNATAPIVSISQSMLQRDDVKGTPLEAGMRAICDTSRHLSDLVVNYRKMSELEKPVLENVMLRPMLDDVCKAYPELDWEVKVGADVCVRADGGMMRQVLMNLAKNAVEAEARKMVVEGTEDAHGRYLTLYVGNDGVPIPAENRQSLFVPFFTTKRNGNGIGLSLSRRMMVQQGGMLDLSEMPRGGSGVVFALTVLQPQVGKSRGKGGSAPRNRRFLAFAVHFF